MLQSIDNFLSARIFLVAKLELFPIQIAVSSFFYDFTWFVGKARTANLPENYMKKMFYMSSSKWFLKSRKMSPFRKVHSSA